MLGGAPPLPFVAPTRWGGLLLTLVVTLATFATALPLGLALALGRRSRLPVVRWVCTAFVEGMRAVPLLAVLFIAATLLPMFLPTGWNVDLFTRALLAFALFNAAMAAEVFRGGLQTVGRGQIEAATTVGLSDFAALRMVVLPQAVTAVVPALVNIMIAVIKETTLLSVIGVNDLLGAVENGAKSPGWVGESNVLHLRATCSWRRPTSPFCYGLSRYSPAAGNPPLNSWNEAMTHRPDTPPDPNAPVVRMDGINKWYGAYHALRDIDLQVAPGERIVICGPSGSGKSTLVRTVNLLEPFQQGRLQVCGVEVGADEITPRRAAGGEPPRRAWCSSSSTCSRT